MVTPIELKCEYAVNPLGIDVNQPRFSWVLEADRRGQRQSAYQILVAGSKEAIASGSGDKWDSGKVASEGSVNVVYEGETLTSGEVCWWKVRVWDVDDTPGPWSEAATFSMGLLETGDWQGKWIAAAKEISSPLLRKEIELDKKVKKANVYISGLGYYELYINGERVGDHVLDPGTTYYNNDEPIELGARVLYATYEVSAHLQAGANALGVMLGHGWYSAEADIPPSPIHREPYGDRPRLILQIDVEFVDGAREHIASDDTWKVAGGPITYNDYCHGETYDARLEKPGWDKPGYDDSAWEQASLAEAPGGVMTAQALPPIRVMKTLKPVRILRPKEGTYVFDFGQHFCGWCRLRLQGPGGAQVRLKHGACVYDDGTLDARSNLFDQGRTDHVARQTDTYILKGEGTEVWEPRFTLHGFRYVEIEGYPGEPGPDSLEGRVVYSSVDTTGSFTCSNALINQIHHNICWTFTSSMQGFPQDAADRAERVGWLGDPIAEDYIFNFDTAGFWTKWADDLKDAQKPDGDIPVVCPLHWRRTHDAFRTMPVWKSTYPLVVWYVYEFYDDERILATHYDGMVKLVEFLRTKSTDHIISEGLGDHMEPQTDGTTSHRPLHTPPALTSTAYYYFDAWLVALAAKILGKSGDARDYGKLAAEIKEAFNREFLHRDTHQYASGSQTANALPLALDMVPEDRVQAVVKNLLDDIATRHNGHLSTGLIGTNALALALPRYGAADVLYGIATRTSFPSWGYQIERGATTLWETWDGNPEEKLSYNMKIFGSIDKFFYKDLAGIRPAAPGFRRMVIKPCVVGDLTYVRASTHTVRGLVAVEWKRGDAALDMSVTIPVNSRAELNVPKIGLQNVSIKEGSTTIWEDGTYSGGVAGIDGGSQTPDYVTFDVGSGSYDLQLAGH